MQVKFIILITFLYCSEWCKFHSKISLKNKIVKWENISLYKLKYLKTHICQNVWGWFTIIIIQQLGFWAGVSTIVIVDSSNILGQLTYGREFSFAL